MTFSTERGPIENELKLTKQNLYVCLLSGFDEDNISLHDENNNLFEKSSLK